MAEEKSSNMGWKGPETNPAELDECKLMAAMDQWFSCFTVGKQLNNIYRYGHKRNCEKHWDKLKLCLKAVTVSSEEKKLMLKAYSQNMEQERRSQPNVLDIWEFRDEPFPGFRKHQSNGS